MSAHDAMAFRFAVPVFAAAGFALGMGYFASLRHLVRRLVAYRAWSPYVLATLARIGVAALFFAFAARWGVAPLVAAFAGFLAARQLVVRSARRIA